MGTEALARVLREIPLLKLWMDEVEAHALALLLKGESIPGFKLVAGRANRKWVDEPVAATQLTAWLGVDVAMPRSVLSPAQAEKQLKLHKVSGAEEFMQDNAPKRTGEPAIAPYEDPRPEIQPFTEFTDDVLK